MEVLQSPSTAPSLPSGYTRQELDQGTGEHNGIYWLVEERRSSVVTKFSGTMEYPSKAGRNEETMYAFSHFVWQYTGYQRVLADVQGMY